MRNIQTTASVMMMVTTLAATVLGAPQFWEIPVPNKPADLYELPSQDSISIPKPVKPSGLYDLPTAPSNRIVLGDPILTGGPILPEASDQVTTALPLPTTTLEPQPLMPYEMSYNIMDGINNVYHTREEVQTDTGLTGSYSYLRPDGIYQTVEYYVDNMGYHANVIESEEAPANLQRVESNRAKYEVKLPQTNPYLIDVTDDELQQYIQNAMDFESAVIPQEPQQVAQASNINSQEIQTPVLMAQPQLTFPQVQPPQLNPPQLQPPQSGLQPPFLGYNYQAPKRPFNPLAG